ncbi:MAG: hypothetical protein ACKV1O_24025 [Saprospiraceae bacterium]
MKSLTVIYSSFFLFLAVMPSIAQPVIKMDPFALLETLTPPPTNAATARSRAFINGTTPNASLFYQPWNTRVEKVGQAIQAAQMQFYKENPMGVHQPAQPVSHATPQQESAMNSATNKLAQKMLADPALAQKIMAMSEAEQHAYIAKLLAEEGVVPVAGVSNSSYTGPGGLDINWVELHQNIVQPAMDLSRWDAHNAMAQKYDNMHQAVNDQANADVQKLPLIEMGEYGRDHDPEKVKAIQLRASSQHRELATAKLKEALPLFEGMVKEFRARIQPFQEALKARKFGDGYDFGIHYKLVLDTQMAVVMELLSLSKYAADLTDDAARWESSN